MKVLTDFHHAGLLHSLILLFEGRLGYELYRPIGTEWAEEGFWKVYDHPATIQQYLTLAQGYQPEDGSLPLNNIEKVEDDIYYCQDIDSGYYNKAITLDKFKNTKFDIIIASLPQHIEPFKRLIAEYQPQAKLIFQVGNQWTVNAWDVKNVMASALIKQYVPAEVNLVEYHQEFDLDIFRPKARSEVKFKRIISLMNCPDGFKDYPLLLDIEKKLPDWDVKIHGGMGRDEPLHGASSVAEHIRLAQWVWHVKEGGDGYGHILFNTGACGVPTIVKKSYYTGKMGDKLLIDGVTCIDIDGLDVDEIVEHIKYYSEPKIYSEMQENVIKNFREHVDFEADAQKVKEFIGKLQ